MTLRPPIGKLILSKIVWKQLFEGILSKSNFGTSGLRERIMGRYRRLWQFRKRKRDYTIWPLGALQAHVLLHPKPYRMDVLRRKLNAKPSLAINCCFWYPSRSSVTGE